MVETCDKGWEVDRISQLPDHLICEILAHLPTKDVVRTSVLSTRWRNLWQLVPSLDLDSKKFSDFNGFVNFTERFFDSHKESWIRKLRLNIHENVGKSFFTRWIDSVTAHRIQHVDVCFDSCYRVGEIPHLSIYTCETLVHLRLYGATLLVNAEFVSLPCLKVIHVENIRSPDYEATLEKLISGCPALEDLTIIRSPYDDKAKVFHVRSHTLKRIDINACTQVVIDAPLLQCLRTKVYLTKNFQINSLSFPAKLDIDLLYTYGLATENVISDILTDISRVRDLVISWNTLKEIFLYFKLGPVLQFGDLFCLNARFSKSRLQMLPTLLESCPQLESLILELFKDPSVRRKKKKQKLEPKMMSSKVPRCLVSSLKFVELKHSISGYEGEIELASYFLKNSQILGKLWLNIYYTNMTKRAVQRKLSEIPSACEVLVR